MDPWDYSWSVVVLLQVYVCVFLGFTFFFSTLRGRDFSINMNEMVSVFCLVSIGVFFRFRRGDRMYMIIFCRKKFI